MTFDDLLETPIAKFFKMLQLDAVGLEETEAGQDLDLLARVFDFRLAVHSLWLGSVFGGLKTVGRFLAERNQLLDGFIDLGWINSSSFDATGGVSPYCNCAIFPFLKETRLKSSEVKKSRCGRALGSTQELFFTECVEWQNTQTGSGDKDLVRLHRGILRSGWSGVMVFGTDSSELGADPRVVVSVGCARLSLWIGGAE